VVKVEFGLECAAGWRSGWSTVSNNWNQCYEVTSITSPFNNWSNE